MGKIQSMLSLSSFSRTTGRARGSRREESRQRHSRDGSVNQSTSLRRAPFFSVMMRESTGIFGKRLFSAHAFRQGLAQFSLGPSRMIGTGQKDANTWSSSNDKMTVSIPHSTGSYRTLGANTRKGASTPLAFSCLTVGRK